MVVVGAWPGPVDLGSAEPGERVAGEMLVVEASVATTKNGSPYLRAMLRDRPGRSIPTKFWDFDGQPPATGQVVVVSGLVDLHGERRQLVLESLSVVGPADPAEWAVEVDMPLARRAELVRGAIDAVEDGELASVVRWVFGEPAVLDRFLVAPAAKRKHSARVGGLAVHTLNVLGAALDLARYPSVPVDLDLLRAGALLHDVGKIDELEVTVATGLLPGYTVGHLQGHVALSVRRIERAAVCCGIESPSVVDRLVHLVVSHHGSREWGAPEPPMTLEALVLHLADLAASRIEGACEAISGAPIDAEWTDYAPMFGERLYVGA